MLQRHQPHRSIQRAGDGLEAIGHRIVGEIRAGQGLQDLSHTILQGELHITVRHLTTSESWTSSSNHPAWSDPTARHPGRPGCP